MTQGAIGGQPFTPPSIDPTRFEAVLFDLDGVLTKTAVVHATAWKRLFDEYLQARALRDHAPFQPFDILLDYQRYVDGKLRYDGVRAFLESRRIVLPNGTAHDGPEQETVQGLGNKKDGYFQAHLAQHGIELYNDAVRFLRNIRAQGIRTAVVSASKHTAAVLRKTGLADSFETRVDGIESERLHLAGKPAPDGFLEAARRLHVEPLRAIVVEDAVAGVQAGRNGGFGLVIGVDRTGHAEDLIRNGAHLVTADLTELCR
ncbi:MAG: beta-phosphoglucomutase family hydrolase [Nitrospira sp. CR1.2]|nr:beta-phosphoglucomutase family hydrolase [Nitrospira sp. CR1.2]